MRPSFSLTVDTVDVPPRAPLLGRSRTAPANDEGIGLSSRRHSSDAAPSREDVYIGLTGLNGKPYDYPAPVLIRNTFVALVPGRDPSLDEFYEERRNRSCPPSWGPTLGEFKEKEDDAGTSRTTACGSASDGSGAASTPPLSDAEDTAEMSPRGIARAGPSARAAMMPSSSTGFRKTLSDYRREPEAQPSATGQQFVPAASSAVFVPEALQRQPLPPGPIQGTLPQEMTTEQPANYNSGFLDGLRAMGAVFGYEPAYEMSYEQPAFDMGYESQYVNGYDVTYAAGYEGYHPGFVAYDAPVEFAGSSGGFAASSGDFVMPIEVGPSVLQLSPAIQPSAQPPPPPGAPAPMAWPAAWPSSPPSDPPAGVPADPELAPPTRGSMNHGQGHCKPCAFVFTKGCGNGFDCPFCHLCEQGEKKKRRKEKLESRRVMREIRKVFPFGNTGYGVQIWEVSQRMQRVNGQWLIGH